MSIENEQLWEHCTWLFGMLMEKGIITEGDVAKHMAFDELGTLPAMAELEIVDDTPVEEEPKPSGELLELERFVNRPHRRPC